jgi:hypothetical protein
MFSWPGRRRGGLDRLPHLVSSGRNLFPMKAMNVKRRPSLRHRDQRGSQVPLSRREEQSAMKYPLGESRLLQAQAR